MVAAGYSVLVAVVRCTGAAELTTQGFGRRMLATATSATEAAAPGAAATTNQAESYVSGRKLQQADSSAGQTVTSGRKLHQADGSTAQSAHSGRKMQQADGSAAQSAHSGRKMQQADGAAGQTVNSGGATAPSVRS